eukprot:gene9574-biopygen7694
MAISRACPPVLRGRTKNVDASVPNSTVVSHDDGIPCGTGPTSLDTVSKGALKQLLPDPCITSRIPQNITCTLQTKKRNPKILEMNWIFWGWPRMAGWAELYSVTLGWA